MKIIKKHKFFLLRNIDKIGFILYIFMVLFGYINLYSVSHEKAEKQLLWILFSFISILIIFLFKPIHYKNITPFFFLFTLILLIGLFFLGKNINGSKSWYVLGPISFQPSELAKISTSLMISHILSRKDLIKNQNKFFLYAFLSFLIPAILICIQPDPGSSVVFSSFIFTLYREGLSIFFIFYLLLSTIIFLISIVISPWRIVFPLFIIFFSFIIYNKKNLSWNNFIFYSFFVIICSLISIGSPFFFKNFFKKHHKDRINILFQNEFKKQYRGDIGYNLLYSKTAIGSGKLFGKGYQQGTITKGKFVPEQHTDYIFCALGEEWGFLGCSILVILYLLFISRIYFLSDQQKDIFCRTFGYSVGNILFIHFFINLGMVMGIFPTIGIVLPFFSYGGSSLLSFTILVFLFMRINVSNRISLV
ncbi:rod shape-determining protein RodA [Blattabacterium cuenoti]|uniref:rod shape-determining protein RodA n=1 Tax=Blattabacterium cuenoti TaxID=1653831 RepID=UPI00293BF8BD|nr:rod shape-determining protein RodA [Blattabacterium cuenoti]